MPKMLSINLFNKRFNKLFHYHKNLLIKLPDSREK
jgi:hypothetical protein